MATHGLVKFISGLLPFVSCFASTSERLKRPQSGTDFETMVPHVAAVVYFTEYFVQVISASLRISMNYTENVTELLEHVRTVDTRCSSPQLPSAWERG